MSLRLLEGEHAFLHILLVQGRVRSGQAVQVCIAQVFGGDSARVVPQLGQTEPATATRVYVCVFM